VTLPFAALHQLLYPVLDQLPALPAPQSAALGAAFGLTPGRSDDPFLVAVAALTLVSEVSAGEGLLCLVDDAQWLDGPSADALMFVARRLDAEGVVLLFGARDDDQRNFTAAGLSELRLAGLEPVAAAALLQETASGLAVRVRDQLVTRTTGNPLALLELPAMLTAAQRAGLPRFPSRCHSLQRRARLRGKRASQLSPAAQHLLLVGSAEETGTRDRLAGRRCPGQRPGRAGGGRTIRSHLGSERPVGSSGIRLCAPPSNSTRPFGAGKMFTATSRRFLEAPKMSTVGPGTTAAAAVRAKRGVAAELENPPTAHAAAAVPGRPLTHWSGPRS
jgi:hypothetical protein